MRVAGSMLLSLLAAGLIAVAGCASEVPPTEAPAPPVHVASTFSAMQTRAAGASSIGYQGGPVMLGTPDVYFIWYGDWTGTVALTLLPEFMSNLGGSPYLRINSTYHDAQGRAVTGDVNYAGSSTDAYSRGTSLSEGDISQIVTSALSTGALPTSTNAVYFVLTSVDVKMAGFCGGFCGWHTHANMLGSDIKFSFIGNPAQCPKTCAPYAPSPNGDVAADGMASIVAHELEETLTDPDLNGWVDAGSQENGDKCAWRFGTSYQTPTGAWANMRLGTRDYLIQSNLDRITNRCELALPQTIPLGVKILAPDAASTLRPGGPLDIVAQATGSAAVTSAVVHWTAGASTTDFAMAKNGGGNWELATTMSTAAKIGTRTFTVTATDGTGTQVTTSPMTLEVVAP